MCISHCEAASLTLLPVPCFAVLHVIDYLILFIFLFEATIKIIAQCPKPVSQLFLTGSLRSGETESEQEEKKKLTRPCVPRSGDTSSTRGTCLISA